MAQEKEDTECAKKSVLNDVEAAHEFKELCNKDDEVARKVHEQLQDEMLAEELQRKEDESFKELQLQQRQVDKQRAQRDFELARQTQIALDVRAANSKSAQEKKDAAVALKMAIATSRDDHRRRKRLEVVHSPGTCMRAYLCVCLCLCVSVSLCFLLSLTRTPSRPTNTHTHTQLYLTVFRRWRANGKTLKRMWRM